MTQNGGIEARLWDAANELRANSRLRASEYSTPVLGLVFLRYADHRFQATAGATCSGRSTSTSWASSRWRRGSYTVTLPWRGAEPENMHGGAAMLADRFGPAPVYRDVPGLCRSATLAEIEAQGWSLNPGRYVGVAEREEEDFDFKERLRARHAELERLNREGWQLEERIAENVALLLEEGG